MDFTTIHKRGNGRVAATGVSYGVRKVRDKRYVRLRFGVDVIADLKLKKGEPVVVSYAQEHGQHIIRVIVMEAGTPNCYALSRSGNSQRCLHMRFPLEGTGLPVHEKPVPLRAHPDFADDPARSFTGIIPAQAG